MVESSASEVGSPPAGIRSSGIAVQFVGGGRMGEAIIAGLIRSGELRAEEIAVVEALPARRDQLRVTYPQMVLGDVPTAAPTVIPVKLAAVHTEASLLLILTSEPTSPPHI